MTYFSPEPAAPPESDDNHVDYQLLEGGRRRRSIFQGTTSTSTPAKSRSEGSWLDDEAGKFRYFNPNDGCVSPSSPTSPVTPLQQQQGNDLGGTEREGGRFSNMRQWTLGSWHRLRSPTFTLLKPSIEPVSNNPENNSNNNNNDTWRIVTSKWNAFTHAYRHYILLLTILIIWPWGIYSFPRFTQSTDSTFHPIKGSPSEEAVSIFREAYGTKNGGLNMDDPLNPGVIVVLEQRNGTKGTLVDGTSAVYNQTKDFALGYEGYLRDHLPNGQTETPTKQEQQEEKQVGEAQQPPEIQVISYYSLVQNDKLPHLAKSLVTHNGHTTILQIKYSVPSDIAATSQFEREYISSILDAITTYGSTHAPTDITVSHTGLKYFQSDLIQSTHADLRRMDVFVLPLALCILALVLRAHCSIMIIPIVTILTTIFGWSIVMSCWLCKVMQITQFTPSVMMSLTIGMSIDYTLFLLSRFIYDVTNATITTTTTTTMMMTGIGTTDNDAIDTAEVSDEPQQQSPSSSSTSTLTTMNQRKYYAIESSIRSAGHTILASGITLQCTFLGLTLLPLEMLRSVGVGSAVAVGIALAVNLSVLPAMLHTRFGNYILPRRKKGKMDDDGDSHFCHRHRHGCARRFCFGDGGGTGTASTTVSSSEQVDGMFDGIQSRLLFNGGCIRHRRSGGQVMNNETELAAEGVGAGMRDITHSQIGKKDDDQEEDTHYTSLQDVLAASRNTVGSSEQPKKESFWFRLARHLLHPIHSVTILALVLAVLLPISYFAVQITSSISFELILPSTSPSLKTFHDLGNQFGSGTLSPYRIIFDGHISKKRIDTEEGFEVMHKVLAELEEVDKIFLTDTEEDGNEQDPMMTDVNLDSIPLRLNEARGNMFEVLSVVTEQLFGDLNESQGSENGGTRSLVGVSEEEEPKCNEAAVTGMTGRKLSENGGKEDSTKKTRTVYNGIAIVRNIPIPHPLYVGSKLCAEYQPHCPLELLHLIVYIDHAMTSEDRMTTYATATLGVNPFSDDGVKWLLAARKKIDDLKTEGCLQGYRVVIDGGAAVEYDAVQEVYHAFPSMIGLTLCVVFVLMGAFFRSVVVPLRSVVSICLTLSFAFGLCVLVYQHGILNWTHLHSISSLDGEISWLAPVMAFSIIVGLGLDYDVFLIGRVLEYRLEGYDHKSSIAMGLHATGGIITAAGVIMAVAFGGLMLSTSPALYQWSFLLTFAVLLDTFVIRTLVVPILMGYSGKYSWWPRKLPEERINLLSMDGRNSNEREVPFGVWDGVDDGDLNGEGEMTAPLIPGGTVSLS